MLIVGYVIVTGSNAVLCGCYCYDVSVMTFPHLFIGSISLVFAWNVVVICVSCFCIDITRNAVIGAAPSSACKETASPSLQEALTTLVFRARLFILFMSVPDKSFRL
jgi:hypothetical protein